MIINDVSKLSDFKKIISNKKFNKIFLITGKNSYFKSQADKFFNFPKNKLIKFYFKRSFLPEFDELKIIINELRNFDPDLILAIGGGAVIDYAKILSIAEDIEINDLRKKLINYEKISKKKLYPLIAVPTTAGAGAEVTSNAVIYINKIKYSVEDKLLIPNYFFLFSNLILNNPIKLKSAAGFDAIAQAVESLISVKSSRSSVSFAKKSLILSSKNYLPFLINPTNDNSKKMLLASNLAGKAINISKTTAPHAVSYPFSTLFGISHGHAVSLTFEKFLLFNYQKINFSSSNFDLKKRYQIIFNLAKVNNIQDLDFFLNKIKINTGLENNLKKLGVSIKSDYRKILSGVNVQRLKNNPINLNRNDIKNILLNK